MAAVAQEHSVYYHVLRSIYRLKVEEKVKSQQNDHQRRSGWFYDLYLASPQTESTLLELSEKYDIQPYFMAKYVLQGLCLAERAATGASNTTGPSESRDVAKEARDMALQWLKKPALILSKSCDSALLQQQVNVCFENDDTFGPLLDQSRRNAGMHYESILAQHLLAAGARFLNDGAMKAVRLSKTPDALLVTPLVVAGVTLRWVESKGLFGDPDTMAHHVESQLLSYCDRYGPGLVIYWLGFVADTAESIMDTHRSIVIRDSFPVNATLLSSLTAE